MSDEGMKLSCRFCRASARIESPGTFAQVDVAKAEVNRQCNCKPRLNPKEPEDGK